MMVACNIHQASAALLQLPRCFFQKNTAGNPSPALICVREEMADIGLAHRAQDGITDGMHQGIGVRMAVQAFGVGNVHASKHQATPGYQGMNIISNSNVNHT